MYTQTKTRNGPQMQDNRQSNGELSDFKPSMDKISEAIKRLKIRNTGNQEGGGVGNGSPYPDRPGEPDCIYYLRTGMCAYGSNCKFNHPLYAVQVGQYNHELPQRVGQPDCEYFLKTGTCKYGPTCKYHHPMDRRGAGPIWVNILGLPIRQDEKSCPYYMRTGMCKFGVACKFNHPQPASSYGPTSYAFMGSSTTPSSSTYVGGLATWSLPKGTYMSTPSIQGAQTYMPIVLPSSQGWNAYMGSNSPTPSSMLVEAASNGQVHLISPSVSHLPERPGQPDCRYFLSTGSCKYGPECKYHHPKEKIVQLASNSLGPLGLPMRPGQAVCSFYNLYGLCKYGPNCKFDHPLTAYVCNYDLGVPAISALDPNILQFQKIHPSVHPLETPPSKSKTPDKIKKAEMESDRNQNSETIMSQDPHEAANKK